MAKIRDLAEFSWKIATFAQIWPFFKKIGLFSPQKLAIFPRNLAILWRIWRFRTKLGRGDIGDKVLKNWRNWTQKTWELCKVFTMFFQTFSVVFYYAFLLPAFEYFMASKIKWVFSDKWNNLSYLTCDVGIDPLRIVTVTTSGETEILTTRIS